MDNHKQKNKTTKKQKSYILHKNQLKVDQRLTCKMQNLKLREDRRNLDELGHGNAFLDADTRHNP